MEEMHRSNDDRNRGGLQKMQAGTVEGGNMRYTSWEQAVSWAWGVTWVGGVRTGVTQGG